MSQTHQLVHIRHFSSQQQCPEHNRSIQQVTINRRQRTVCASSSPIFSGTEPMKQYTRMTASELPVARNIPPSYQNTNNTTEIYHLKTGKMWTVKQNMKVTSSKYPSSGRSKLLSRLCGPLDLFSRPFGPLYLASRSIYCLDPAGLCPPYLSRDRSIYSLSPSGFCPAEVRSFISIHQVAAGTALLLLLLLLRACFFVVRQVSLS